MNWIKNPLRVSGTGAITPFGRKDSLQNHETWPVSSIPRLSDPSLNWAASQVDRSLLKPWQTQPRLRRAASISYFMVDAAQQAMQTTTVAPARIGLVAALFSSCVGYSRRFFQGACEDGAALASPALFPETVFNSPASHLVSILKLGGPTYSIIGDETAWVTALITASVWLEKGDADAVLVVGAEELDVIALEAYAAAGWIGRYPHSLPTEGAGAVLLEKSSSGPGAKLSLATDGFAYTNPKSASHALEKALESAGKNAPIFAPTLNPWQRSIYQKVVKQPAYDGPFAFTASAAWDTLRAVTSLSENQSSFTLPVCGSNHQMAVLRWSL